LKDNYSLIGVAHADSFTGRLWAAINRLFSGGPVYGDEDTTVSNRWPCVPEGCESRAMVIDLYRAMMDALF